MSGEHLFWPLDEFGVHNQDGKKRQASENVSNLFASDNQTGWSKSWRFMWLSKLPGEQKVIDLFGWSQVIVEALLHCDQSVNEKLKDLFFPSSYH